MARTGLVFDEEMILHDTGPNHPERPARLKAIIQAFEEAGLVLPRVPIEPASEEDILRVHSWDHLEEIRETCLRGLDYPNPDTPMGPLSWRAALLAAGGAISACRAVIDGAFDNVFCAVRPPGHHAERDRAMGFCLFNNIAIAARWLQAKIGLRRIAILDWDVHHGNGTQQAFFDDPAVLFVSLHQHPHYPGTGWPFERGAENTTLNIQMPRGCGTEEWLAALDEKAVPALARFEPEFLLVSAGFDTHHLDPLGGQNLEAETFAHMTRRIAELADGRIVSILEGGYHLEALGASVVAHVKALQDCRAHASRPD
ncbi:MAG TPA: histone deacetylase [Candidatus Hydrogenedentes bacterium]|nr:histone deacetylase [Candidatus Hydrogenedentota bacterium]HPC17276.1 histone deacetylase [Candidatus Hydrogenedentota bacterium]HRT21191.1 histone deacetylase [Candidatus Hydrogenedentota bacterium]HRT65972.1 histone deacetylase [Candidatus Hydrogenedentota bacterium]